MVLMNWRQKIGPAIREQVGDALAIMVLFMVCVQLPSWKTYIYLRSAWFFAEMESLKSLPVIYNSHHMVRCENDMGRE
jgi:hypothetical protein